MEPSFEQPRFASLVVEKIKRILDSTKLWECLKLIVYFMIKVLGLAPFGFENDRFYRCSWLGLIYPIFLSATYSLMALLTGQKWFTNFTRTESILRLTKFNVFANTVPTALNVLIFLILRKKLIRLANDLYDFSRDFEIAGIVEENDKFIQKSIAITLTMIPGISLPIIMAYSTLNDSTFVSVIVPLIENLITLKIILMFTLTMILIEERFKLVNKKLYEIMESARESFVELSEDLQQPNSGEISERNFMSSERRISYPARVRMIEGLHLRLCGLLNRVVNIFSGPILLIIIRLFHSFAYIIYVTFIFIRNQDLPERVIFNSRDMWYRGYSVGLIPIFQLFSIAHFAVKTSREAGTTRTILTKTWAKFNVPELEDEFMIFHTQLLHNWHYISVFDFFPLDYSFLYKLKKLWNHEKNTIESTEEDNLNSRITEATELLRDSNKPLEDALFIIKKGLLSNPRSHHLYSLRGDIYVKKGNWKMAIRWYETARKMLQFDDKYSHSGAMQIQYHEKLKNSYRERGRWHEKNHRLIEAVADYEQALLLHPNINEIYELQDLLLRCLRKLNKYEAYRVAWSEFMKGVRPQRSADLMTQHAEFKIHIREVAAARRMLRKAVSLDEENMDARDLLEVIIDTGHTMLAYAIIWCINGCYDKALMTIDKGTDCDPYNPGFTVLKTIVLRLSGRLEEAFQWLNSVNRAFYKLLEPTHNKRGSIMGNLSVSQTRAMLIDQWYLIRYDKAVEHAINGRYEMALNVLRNEQLLQKFPESKLLMGDCLQRQGKIDSTLKAFLQAHEQSVATGCWQKSEKRHLIAQRIMEILNSRALSDIQKKQSRKASKTIEGSLKVIREERVGITRLGSQRSEALMYAARSGYQMSPTKPKSRDQCLRILANSISFARGVDDGGIRSALLGDDADLEQVISCFASEKRFPYHTKILLQN